MRASTVASSLNHRLRKKDYWYTVGILGSLLFINICFKLGIRQLNIHDLFFIFVYATLCVFPGIIGWQWSGDDRVNPGFVRGLSQSLICCGLLLAGYFLSEYWYQVSVYHHRPGW
jgi:hypothetical protein